MPIRQLFGGAIEAEITSDLADISHLREVPDHQEFYADTTDSDRSLIIEINQLASDASSENCAQYHFQELCDDMKCSGSIIDKVELVGPNDTCFSDQQAQVQFLQGRVLLSKNTRNPNELTHLLIYLATIRIPEVETDLLVIYHIPLEIISDNNIDLTQWSPSEAVLVEFNHFRATLKTFKINNWGIFGQ
ncbi:hypothetical protein DSO57_1010574 [Entomophthora muscae]|uniref:Uncharacterized protein n=1 Tax=Entomophthora muscae TaxID=34485 RepID=A0ACC2TH65_9FUNG|nr:hypothetical protein DSO57_1010574 [Entomophthora muscae]